MNNNTVEFAVRAMCFMPYTHILVRTRKDRRIDVLGGGRMIDIIKRYGDLEIVRSFVSEDTLYIDVKNIK